MPVLQNLENKIKLTFTISVLVIIACIIISLGSIFIARGMVADSRKSIYVLDGTVPVLVHQTDQDARLAVEAKADVEAFHHLFFTLSPDDKYIQYTINKALYLIDESGAAQYNALKEKGFYNNIVGTSSVCTIFCDSIKFDQRSMKFIYYGRQRIERRTSILYRSLVTAGSLRRIPRSPNNPYGLLIVNWRTLKNQDIEQQAKTDF